MCEWRGTWREQRRDRLKPLKMGSIELFAPFGGCYLTLDLKNNIYDFGRFIDNLTFS